MTPGHKLTALGPLPEDWDVVPLGATLVGRPRYGINAAAVPYSDRLPTYIRITDISSEGKFAPTETVSVDAPGTDGYVLTEGDIVFARTGASVGKSYCYRREDGPLVFAGFLIRVRPNPEILLPGFLAAYATTGGYWAWVRLMSMRSGQPGINGNEYAQLPVPLPPLAEQKAIAAALSDVDALLDALDRLIAKKRDLKQAAMQQLLTGQTRLPGFTGKWEAKRFSDIFTRVNSKAYQIQTTDYQPTGTLPVVDQGQAFIVGFSDRTDKRFRCPRSGVVVFGDHTCIVKFVDFDFVIGADGTQLLAPKNGHSARFHYLHLDYKAIEQTGYNRHFKFVRERDFSAPPLHEQDAIADVIFDMQNEIVTLEQRRDKTRLLKQGMMQELLTGRTRLV